MIRTKQVESFKAPIMTPYTKTVFKEDIRCKILHQENQPLCMSCKPTRRILKYSY